jgi:hypothetical protein
MGPDLLHVLTPYLWPWFNIGMTFIVHTPAASKSFDTLIESNMWARHNAPRGQVATDPRVVGGRYLSGHFGQEYRVLDIGQSRITVEWSDGRVATHGTGWEPRVDRELI